MSEKVVCALMIGRSNSKGFPGKNTCLVLGRPLCEYPLMAAQKSNNNIRIFVSTDCHKIKEISKKYNAEFIERPTDLATDDALGEDAFLHGYREIKKILSNEGKILDLLVLLFANAATISPELIDEGIDVLRSNASFDSAVTTSVYNMWSPLRARRLTSDGHLVPFVPFEVFGDPESLSCDRDSQGNVYFADMSVSVVRPHCMEKMNTGLLPQKWMGQQIAPIFSWGGCDVDYEWQLPVVEFWLKKHGIHEKTEK